MNSANNPDVDVVVIGGKAAAEPSIASILSGNYPEEALRVCLIDTGKGRNSGSTDSRVELLHAQGRANRGGLENQAWRTGDSACVQFLDAGSLLDRRWLQTAIRTLQNDPDLAAVFGSTENTDGNVFEQIANLELNPPEGYVPRFGPEVLIRRKALEESGGYDPRLRSGEDLELSLRLLQDGWRIRKLDARMSGRTGTPGGFLNYLRDAYCRGYAYAAATALHGRHGGYWVECLRILIRGCLAPACVVLGQFGPVSIWTGWLLSLAGLATFFYPRLFSLEKYSQRLQVSVHRAGFFAWHAVVVVIPEFFGLLRALPDCLFGLLWRRHKGPWLPSNSRGD